MKHIEVIAFDCDGVMFDSEGANTAYYNSILAYMNRPGMTPAQIAHAHMHTADEVLANLFAGDELKKAHAFRKKVGYLPFIQYMEIEPDLISLLRSLRPRFKTAVASNRTDTMPHVIQNHALEGLFDHVVTALDVARPKPDPEMLNKVLAYFSITPAQMIYVGDSELDEQAARAAGVELVAFGNRNLSAAHHIDSMEELKQLIEQTYH